jgi:exportin-1
VTCKPIGPIYRGQIVSIASTLSQCYEIASEQPQEQLYKRIRQLILELLETFVLSNEYLELQDQNMLSNLIQVILADYKNTTNVDLREPHVLSLLTSMFEKMQVDVESTTLEVFCLIFFLIDRILFGRIC